jgi:hypothetical protein
MDKKIKTPEFKPEEKKEEIPEKPEMVRQYLPGGKEVHRPIPKKEK